MSVSVSCLFNENHNPYRLCLVAGKCGLAKEVSWVQVMENSGYASFLMQNELIFTTGMGKGNDSGWLRKFILSLMNAGSAGAVLNIGKYLRHDDITPDLISLCDERQFPLFTMPWDMRLADVTQSFLYTIFRTKQTEYEVSQACCDLFFEQHCGEAVRCLAEHGFSEQAAYQVISLFLPSYTAETAEALRPSYKCILNGRHVPYMLFPLRRFMMLVLCVPSAEAGVAVVQYFASHLEASGYAVPPIGSGMVVPSLRDLAVSCRQASYAVAWACTQHKKMQYFGDLGIYAILFSQQNDMVMNELHDRLLGPVLDYDRKRDRNLLDTLVSYLRHNGSIQAVAKETYAHRNTVAYRMQKISSLLQCDLTDETMRFTYLLACHIHQYGRIRREMQEFLD